MNFKEACKKANVTEETAKRMLVVDHEFNSLYSEKERNKLVTIEFEPLPKEIHKDILKICKVLGVSWDAALNAIIMNYVDKILSDPKEIKKVKKEIAKEKKLGRKKSTQL